MLAVQADGHEVTTVEGLGTASELDPVQEGFTEEHGLQCGFCTPGMMLASKALLAENPDPTEDEVRFALSGNLCRCTGYQNIVKAVLWAAAKQRGEQRVTATQESRALDEIKIGGMGASRKRVEDNRFIRGKGNYVDDIVLPGMLHMEILRSPLAHARIKSIDTSAAYAIPGVRLVLTGEMMATRNLAWMPTLSYDTQAVLATDKVRFQGQEVACVIADDPYIAKDGCEAIRVEYEPLPVIVNPTQAMAADAPIIRDDKENQPDNTCFTWEVGDKEATDRAFAEADVVSKLKLHYPRSHPVADGVLRLDRRLQPVDAEADRLHDHPGAAHHPRRGGAGRRAARAHDPDRQPRPRRRLRQQGAGLPGLRDVDPGLDPHRAAGEVDRGPHRQPDLDRLRPRRLPRRRAGAAQGRQDPRRPDAHRLRPRRLLLRRPAQQVQDRADALGVRGYDIPAAHLTARGVYTNKAPGGVAYRCSFRVTEAMFFQERMVQAAADDLGMDQAEFRRVNFVRDDDFPHRTPFGFLTDSGQYAKCLDVGLEAIGYADFRKQQEEARKRGRLLGIGISTMTEPLGAGNSREYDILGIKMFDSAELRVHMTGKAHPAHRRQVPGPGPRDDVGADRRPRARHPGRGHRGRGGRHRHRAVRHGHLRLPQHAGRRRRGRDGVAQDPGQGPQARRAPARGVRGGRRVGARPVLRAQQPGPGREHPGVRDGGVQQHARRHGARPGGQRLLRPAQPDLAVRLLHRDRRGRPADRRLGRAAVRRRRRLRRPDQPDGRRGPDHGRPHRGLRDGEHAVHHLRRRRQLRRLELHGLPAARPRGRRPGWELHEVVTPCPHHPIGAKGVGECATVGGPAAFVNAVIDAIGSAQVRNIDMPLLPDRVYDAITQQHDVSGAPPVKQGD